MNFNVTFLNSDSDDENDIESIDIVFDSIDIFKEKNIYLNLKFLPSNLDNFLKIKTFAENRHNKYNITYNLDLNNDMQINLNLPYEYIITLVPQQNFDPTDNELYYIAQFTYIVEQ